jgi:hypothetical protein
MAILLVILAFILLLIFAAALHSGFCLFLNYRIARSIGVPIRIILFDHVNPFWLVCDRAVVSFVRCLPFGLGNNSFTRYNYRGWELPDRYFSHHELGDAYILVSPGNIWLYIADPDAVTDILRRGKDFPRDVSVTGRQFYPHGPRLLLRLALTSSAILNIFGPNISTVRTQLLSDIL